MKMKATAAIVLVLASLLALAFNRFFTPDREAFNIDVFLGQPRSSMQLELIPPGRDTESKFDFALPDKAGFIAQKFMQSGERIDTYRRPDKSLLATLDYYPLLEGEKTAVLKEGVSYRADGVKDGEAAYGIDGVRTRWGLLLADDTYRVRDFFADGVNVKREAFYVPDPFANDFEPKLVREDVYRETKTLFSELLLNDDGTHTTTWYDGQKGVLKIKHQGRRGNLATVVAYWPGTKKIRLQSESDIDGTRAKFYSLDGIVTSTMSITTYMMTAQYFDSTGSKVLYEQTWHLSREGGDKASFDLERVAELDGDGNAKRELTFENGGLKQDDRNNVTIGGIEYSSVTLKYHADGTLDSVELNPLSGEPSRSEKEAQALHSQIPPQELQADLEEDLPIPPAPAESAGHH